MDAKALKPADIKNLENGLSLITNTGLSIDTLKELLKFRRYLKSYVSDVNELEVAVMDKYGIENVPGVGYQWTKHDKAKEIDKDLADARKLPFEPPKIHFMTLKEFKDCAKDQSSDVMIAIELLIEE